MMVTSWVRAIQAAALAALAIREGRLPKVNPSDIRQLPKGRAPNGKVVFLPMRNRADRRQAARFERKHFGVPFDRAFSMLTGAYRKTPDTRFSSRLPQSYTTHRK